jgi:hypothetical protein
LTFSASEKVKNRFLAIWGQVFERLWSLTIRRVLSDFQGLLTFSASEKVKNRGFWRFGARFLKDFGLSQSDEFSPIFKDF